MGNNKNEKRRGRGINAFLARLGFKLQTRLVLMISLAMIIPIILIVLLTWLQFTSVRELIVDSREAFVQAAIDRNEGISTDLAKTVASFLADRDTDIVQASKLISHFPSINSLDDLFSWSVDPVTGVITSTPVGEIGSAIAHFANEYISVDDKSKPIIKRSEWILGQGIFGRPEYIKKDQKEYSLDIGNIHNDLDNRWRYNFLSDFDYVNLPIYREISLIDLNGNELYKYSNDIVYDTQYREIYGIGIDHKMNQLLNNIDEKENTYVRSEDYFSVFKQGGLYPIDNNKPLNQRIYVSSVIGAYVGTAATGVVTETLINNRNSALKDILYPSLDSEAKKLKPDPITSIPGEKGYEYNINGQINKLAYASNEFPYGDRFEGIVRFAAPIYSAAQELIGYVTLALSHDHIMELVEHRTPMEGRYTEISDVVNNNYAFIWDRECRSIAHPRHHSIVGYDPSTGEQTIPMLERRIYDDYILFKTIVERETADKVNWSYYVFDQFPTGKKKIDYISYFTNIELNSFKYPIEQVFHGPIEKFYRQARPNDYYFPEENENEFTWAPNIGGHPNLVTSGTIALDGRFLNNAPQCIGWIEIARTGGSGSFYILWGGVGSQDAHIQNSIAAIPYYTGQYAKERETYIDLNGETQQVATGFGFVTLNSGLSSFYRPADTLRDHLNEVLATIILQLIIVTTISLVAVVIVSILISRIIVGNIRELNTGINRFRLGERQFRFENYTSDEFGELASSFNDLADTIDISIRTPLSIIDMELRTIYMNDKALELTGHVLSEVINKKYSDISIYPFNSEYCPISALNNGIESKIYYDSFFDVYIQGKASYFYDKTGERKGYIVSTIDYTEIIKIQRELETAIERAKVANAHKSDFLARMSHEIRTPMNAIVGLTTIIERDINNNRQDPVIFESVLKHINQIEMSSKHLLSILNDILDLSKIEAGKIELLQESFDLNELLTVVNNVIIPKCNEKNIEYVKGYDTFTIPQLIGDPLRIRQVLINLLGNAVKFTAESGKVSLTAKIVEVVGTKYKISFEVSDTGIGISPQRLKNLFNPFEQGGADIHRQFGGTGLGLSISNNIVKLYGGIIKVDSTENIGSTFSFDICLDSSNDKAVTSAVVDDYKNIFVGKKILVVDDVEINRLIIIELLRDTGLIIDEAYDGSVAVRMFKDSELNYYDVIIMDIRMPVMDGYIATMNIRNMERADAKSVVIIAATANAYKEDIEKSKESGMNHHISKPIEFDILLNLLIQILINKK